MFVQSKKFIKNFITSGLDLQSKDLDNLRIRFINVFSVVGMVTFFIFGTSYLTSHNYTPGFVEISMGLLAGLNLLLLRYKHDINLASSIVLIIMIVILTFLLITGGIDRTGIYWFATFPILSFFLKEKRESLAWLGLIGLVLVIVSLLTAIGFVVSYSYLEIRQLFASLIVVSVLIFFFQMITENYEKELENKRQQLLSTNRLLSKEVVDREKAEERTLNLLNASKKLEEELKREKSSVEEKVNQRTVELNEEQAKMQASINSLNLGFIMTDGNFKIVNINSTAKRILCVNKFNKALRSAAEVGLNCSLEDIEEELKDSLDLRKHIDSCLREKNIININEVNFDNRVLHFFLSPIALYRKKLDIIGVVIVVEDITEEKILDRSKAEFFSIASHELRTPLTAIRGNTALMKDFFYKEIKNPDLKTMIDDIHESSVRLIQIVNDFLDTSRLEQGRIEFNSEDFDLVTLIDEVFSEFKIAAESSTVKLEIEPSKIPIPLVVADRDRTKQILINLIGNALKFTKQGKVSVTLEPNNFIVKILVKDTGKGIPNLNRNLLFHKFQQASDNILTRDATQGTGLGLYISKLLVEGMGGRIQLESSEENKGTTFSFTLPAIVKTENLIIAQKLAYPNKVKDLKEVHPKKVKEAKLPKSI